MKFHQFVTLTWLDNDHALILYLSILNYHWYWYIPIHSCIYIYFYTTVFYCFILKVQFNSHFLCCFQGDWVLWFRTHFVFCTFTIVMFLLANLYLGFFPLLFFLVPRFLTKQVSVQQKLFSITIESTPSGIFFDWMICSY